MSEHVLTMKNAPVIAQAIKKWSITDLEHELSQIPNQEIREWTRKALIVLPEEFWVVPASKTGRYHPVDECGVGGTVIHTKRAFFAMSVICDSDRDILTDLEISYLLSAILLHDTCKGAKGIKHEQAVSPYLKETMGEDFVEKYPEVMKCIESHMGRWGARRPDTKLEKLVHYADNIASKAHILMRAGNENVDTYVKNK